MVDWKAVLRFIEKPFVFRRLVVQEELLLATFTTQLSFQYLMYATSVGVPGDQIVMVLGGLQAPVMLLLGYTYKLYDQERKKCLPQY